MTSALLIANTDGMHHLQPIWWLGKLILESILVEPPVIYYSSQKAWLMVRFLVTGFLKIFFLKSTSIRLTLQKTLKAFESWIMFQHIQALKRSAVEAEE
jgi:hypothetical protein